MELILSVKALAGTTVTVHPVLPMGLGARAPRAHMHAIRQIETNLCCATHSYTIIL